MKSFSSAMLPLLSILVLFSTNSFADEDQSMSADNSEVLALLQSMKSEISALNANLENLSSSSLLEEDVDVDLSEEQLELVKSLLNSIVTENEKQ